ncbi:MULTISPECIES: NAD-dependent epimerase/dehydratase family protein [unclassified Prochlorococcus]|nr:Ribosome-associated endonuclease [Prochlorococcus sp. MIT 0602]KGG17464.1 Ribosome-associated endonuclease [Prochlorococcus sp. MIT 0603]
MGGTRFVGKALVRNFMEKGYDITIFTRGKKEPPQNIRHINGDRNTDDIKKLAGLKFDVIVDSSGRSLQETKELIEVVGTPNHRLIYISSAGVYADTGEWPVDESSLIDPNSRHIGKVETEEWLKTTGIPFTSFRPTYIYGPGNYNPIEKWFFDRIIYERPIPIPLEGDTITQLGHVSDLADAITLSLDSSNSSNKIYNVSGKKGVTFKGLLSIAAKACGKDPRKIRIESFNPKGLDKKERKLFPLRLNHFLTDISLIQNDLNWQPKFNLEEGFSDSYKNDYLLNATQSPDFNSDITLIGS